MNQRARNAALSKVLYILRDQPGLAVFDIGPDWTVITWGPGPFNFLSPSWPEGIRDGLRPRSPDTELPFCSGLVGWIGYEAGAMMERMPPPRAPAITPDLCFWRVEGALCWSRSQQQWRLTGDDAFQAVAEDAIHAAKNLPEPARPRPWRPDPNAEQQKAYQDGVREILDEIRQGKVYQTNLAWEQTRIPINNPLGTWLALRRANPAWRGAFLQRGDVQILSNSPEMYLEVRPTANGLRAVSAPIKGTARASDGDDARWELWESEKERAELTMIVDLVRNDLGRVARTGSVRAAPRRLRRCGDLLHAEQPVQAILADNLDAFDAVSASFPPGSVTGAPKVSAMNLIHRLEPGPRGIYTGAIGFFGDDGAAHFNVAIRTAIVKDGLARFHVGAGIVADSDPEREWYETIAKGAALAGWLQAR
ncbi:MAG: anthranilate synthase component I family protein [Myxococcota bacterium]